MEYNTRNKELDIIKGICIISIVFTHISHPIIWFGFFMVYGFYYISGYTFRKKALSEFVKDKVLRIYLSFVMANILALLIVKVLVMINENYAIGDLDVITNIKSILAFNTKVYFMGPSWFMFPLLLILFLFYILTRVIKNNKLILGVTFIVFVLTHMFYEQLAQCVWCNCAYINNVGVGLFLCALGYSLKNNKELEYILFHGKYAIEVFVVCTFVMFNISNRVSLDVRSGYCSKPLYNMIAIFAGVYWLIYVSKFLVNSKVISKVLAIVGRYSMSIMYFHILSFSIATLGIHYLLKLPYPENWILAYTDGSYGIISGIIGVVVPMMGAMVMEQVREKIQGRKIKDRFVR